MSFRSRQKVAAYLAIVLGFVLMASSMAPVWAVRNVHVPLPMGTLVAIGVLTVSFVLAYIGKELVALGYDTLRANHHD